MSDKKKDIITKNEMRQIESFIKNANTMIERMQQLQIKLEKHAEIIDDWLFEEEPKEDFLVKLPRDLVEYIQAKVSKNGKHFIFGIS